MKTRNEWNALPWRAREVFLRRHGFARGYAAHTWRQLNREIQIAFERECRAVV
jgi:hypothetical protein